MTAAAETIKRAVRRVINPEGIALPPGIIPYTGPTDNMDYRDAEALADFIVIVGEHKTRLRRGGDL